MIMFYGWTSRCRETTVASDGYLKWCDFSFTPLDKSIHIVFVLFPLLYFPDTLLKILIIGSICITWLYNFSRESFGSGWCYTQNFGSLAVMARILMK